MLLFAVALAAAAAPRHEAGTLEIGDPWSRPTAPGMSMGVAYLSITNHGKSADALVGASSPLADKVELHETSIVDGMARMRPLSEIVLPAGATVKIEPGGIHLMLVGLKAPLERGKTVPLVLDFRHAGRISVQLDVATPEAP